ncbi:blue copper protein-like [Papaver somniferum]|uniref:blue copper protein-like n=1 Tax=Papaver somniferum TaxID=3469 RepID=UPI000E6FC9C0|nr:blue copper protein-like [Papaver somniferum]
MVDGFVWNVGDDAGWSPQTHLNYTRWARPSFLVGDSLRFVYDPNVTDVLEVSYCDFKSCNPTSPLATYNTGNDTIPLTKEAHQYFISSNPVDCNNGMKLDIPVSNSSYVRFWRSGPTYGANGYVNVPKFEDAPTEAANTAEDMSCDSTSSTENGVEVEANSNSSTVAATSIPTMPSNPTFSAGNNVEIKVDLNSSAGGAATSTPATPTTSMEAGGKSKTQTDEDYLLLTQAGVLFYFYKKRQV